MKAIEMKDSELDNVAGGYNDSQFLNVLLRGHPDQPDRYGDFRVYCGTGVNEVEKAWAAVGIDRRYGSYKLNGKDISTEEAYEHAQKVMGVYLKRSDWDW